MVKKILSKIFHASNETQAYYQMREVLREALLPLGFTENRRDIPASLSKQTVFQKGSHQITLYYNMRDREYALLAPITEGLPRQNGLTPQPHNEVLFSLSFPGYDEDSLNSLRRVLEQWLKRLE
jgi:hypothetical protein